jgi:hypothetical protein
MNEPWKFVESLAYRKLERPEIRVVEGKFIDADGKWLGEIGPLDESMVRRIVACVNACRGIPTDTLERAQENSTGPLSPVSGSINAELLAAAESVLAGLNARIDEASRNGLPVPVFEGVAALHLAIARARGEAPSA